MSGIISSRNYYPGDLIYCEESFVQVLPRKLKDILCEWCGKRPFDLRACKQCLAVKYCGKSCQKSDWSTHRLECVKLKNLPDVDNMTDNVRLLGKLILKIKGKDWKNIKKRVLGEDISFDDIDNHYKEMTENPRLNLLFKEIKELTTRYIGTENMPGDVDFIKIFGKIKFNTFIPGPVSFYIGISAFDMECIPNANAQMQGRCQKIWAIKKINKGIDKITIPSIEILSQEPEFMYHDRFPCKCNNCSLPYGESLLTKIIDEKRAYSVICDTEAFLELAAVLFRQDPFCDLSDVIDKLLAKQEGVLGSTNRLRLKLLALKCLNNVPMKCLGGRTLFFRNSLLDLERSMRSVFGEFYSEMLPIYEALMIVYFHLGDPLEASRYNRKAKTIQMHLHE